MELPEFPESLPITLESMPVFERAYALTPPSASDLVFNNLFAWQEHFGYRCSRWREFLLVFYSQEGHLTFLAPLLLSGISSDRQWGERFFELCRHIARHAAEQGYRFRFHPVPETDARRLPKEKFAIIPVRENDDYIYRKEDLALLPGQKFSAKRNLVRQFTRRYAYRYEPLGPATVGAVCRFIRRWKPRGVPEITDIASGEYRMVTRLMENWLSLGLCGGVLFVGDREVAATVGTIVPGFIYGDGPASTVVVHTEHALLEYKGAYQMVNQLFCRHLPGGVVYINREEDLGIEGLRKAKLSYNPCRLVRKCSVTLTAQ